MLILQNMVSCWHKLGERGGRLGSDRVTTHQLGLHRRGEGGSMCGRDGKQIIFQLGVQSHIAICSAEGEQQKKDA